ncbi:acetyl-CoA synthetase [Rhodococcus opacus M213]|uniref:Acetyl-CoA synthetase n=1 Tax=Rhodococcus opacus M213 TaxID=1129896 RepID=K8XKE8_RHOOP|nr:acetyl-CoA synthetase [Rhodococcus opacus M213]
MIKLGTDNDHRSDIYRPSLEFTATANAGPELRAAADEDRLAFWAKQAERLHWHAPFSEVLDWSDAPVAKWFVNGRLNVAYNCVDRHVLPGQRRPRRHPLRGRTGRHPRPDLQRPAR